MALLRIDSQLRWTPPILSRHAVSNLCRNLPQQHQPRTQFSSSPCLHDITIHRRAPSYPPKTSPQTVSNTPRHTVSNPPRHKPHPEPLAKRQRMIPDYIQTTSLNAISQAIRPYFGEKSAHSWKDLFKISHATFLIHFGHLAQHPRNYLHDGTDNFHWPGPPYNSRVWAGGSITWDVDAHPIIFCSPNAYVTSAPWHPKNLMKSTVKQLVCQETIISAPAPDEVKSGEHRNLKVRTQRIYGISDAATRMGEDITNPTITEYRDLVFLPTKTAAEAAETIARPDRVIKPTISPDFSHKLTPQQPLLAEFSALTHNAHRIHLDRSYAREEGFRNLVVHGPLSLYLMIRYLEIVLSRHFKNKGKIVQLDYRNLAPLFCDEEMTICLRKQVAETRAVGESASTPSASASSEGQAPSLKKEGKEQIWDVWITGKEGGYAVKGTAKVV